jgi:SAM dependent carboxyl methyltransferase
MAVTTGMVGHGFYNRNSAPQMAAIDCVLPWLDDAVGGMVLAEDPQTIGLADFGCSEGRNSIAVMRRPVASLQRRTSRPFLTIHSDLPTNDFSELFVGLLRRTTSTTSPSPHCSHAPARPARPHEKGEALPAIAGA